MQQYKYYLSKQYDQEEYYESGQKEYEYLVIRVHKSGKVKNPIIEAAYCDFVEEERIRIKCPKGYKKRHFGKKRKNELIWSY